MPARIDRSERKSAEIVLENIKGNVSWDPIFTSSIFDNKVRWNISIVEKQIGIRDFDHRPRSSVELASGSSNKTFDEVVEAVKEKVETTYEVISSIGRMEI